MVLFELITAMHLETLALVYPPGPNLIPVLPYTTANAANAKTTKTFPLPPVAPAQPPGPALVAAQAQAPAYVAPAPVAAVRNVDRLLYDFWPEMPWSLKPDIAGMTRAYMHNKEAVNVWLQTKPLMSSEDESRWHGVKYFGSGGFGAAGLWVEVNADNFITEVSVMNQVSLNLN